LLGGAVVTGCWAGQGDAYTNGLPFVARVDGSGHWLWKQISMVSNDPGDSVVGCGLAVDTAPEGTIAVVEKLRIPEKLRLLEPDGTERWSVLLTVGRDGRYVDGDARVAFTSDGNLAVGEFSGLEVCTGFSKITLWDAATGRTTKTLGTIEAHDAVNIDAECTLFTSLAIGPRRGLAVTGQFGGATLAIQGETLKANPLARHTNGRWQGFVAAYALP
jgi:hypothetical protein